MKTERIGVFGGTFDPIHNGHLAVALEVREALGLDRMLLVVANDPWQKEGTEVTPSANRLAMAEHAVGAMNALAGAPLLEVSDIEVRRGGETYTADTLEELRSRHPDAALFLLVGSDAAAGLPTWKRPEVVRDLATTVVVDRGGREGGRPPADWPHEVVAVDPIEVSSSAIRRRVASGQSIDGLVPPTVVDDVATFGLYGQAPRFEDYRRPRRRPAPPANPFFRYVFPVLVVLAGAAVFLLWREGTKAVLDTTDGEDVPVVTDPDAPGFLVFAEPTPTLLIAHTTDDDVLTGVSVLARTALDEGGSLSILSADLLVSGIEEDAVLTAAYEAGGVERLETVIGEWMGMGFTEPPMVMTTEQMAAFFELIEPIPFTLNDDLVADDGAGGLEVVIGAGGRNFSADELAVVYGWRNPGAPDATRFNRQLAVWQAWLGEIRAADDPVAATLFFEEGLPPHLRAMGTGTADLEIAPMAPFWIDPDAPIYALQDDDRDWPAERRVETVPLPVGWKPGELPTVQVLDGTGDAANRNAALPRVVAAGGEVVIIGNAPVFGAATTTVTYHLIENEPVATAFADRMGVPVVFDENPNAVVDLTVTIGSDT